MSFLLTDDDAPRMTPAVQWLITATVAVAFLQITVVKPTAMQHALGFEFADLERGRLWSVATYMFVHGGFWHLALNMYSLFLFGPRVEHAWRTAEDDRHNFVVFYLFCGLGGLVFYFLFQRDGLLVGASGAVLGVMLAYAMRWPDEEVMLFLVIPMKVKWLVVSLAALNLFASLGVGSAGTAWAAHLGGLAFAWMFLHSPRGPMDRLRQRIAQAPDAPDETPRAIPRTQARPRERQSEADEVVARSKAVATRKPSGPALRALPSVPSRNPELDRVLDKISEGGIDSLSAAERELLVEMSKRLREER